MKAIFFSIISLSILYTQSVAQWTTDPLNPQLVSNVAWNQNGVQQVSDGNGGTFVYWLDSRVNGYSDTDIYGQHYNAAGVALWEANGRLIVNPLLGYTFFNVFHIDKGFQNFLFDPRFCRIFAFFALKPAKN